MKDGHICSPGPPPAEILFNMNELSQIHRKSGNVPAGSIYSAL